MKATILSAVVLLVCLPAAAFNATTIPVGNAPMQIAANPVTNRIYVANLNDNTISVIDGSSNTVIDTILVGSVPEVVAVNSTTNMIYVANTNGNSVSVIDGSTDAVVSTIASTGSTFLAVNPVTNKIYVGNQLNSTVNVIDGNTNTIVTSISIPGTGVIPEALVVNPVTNLVYLAVDSYEPNKSITIISGATNSIVATLPLPNGASIQWLMPDLQISRIYVVDSGMRAMYVINTASNTITNTVDLSAFHTPYEGAVTPTHEIVVSNYNGGSLIRINPWTLAIDGTWGNGRGPSGIAVNPNTNKMYVSDTFSNIVTVISLGGI